MGLMLKSLKGIGKGLKTLGNVSETLVTGTGNLVLGAGKGVTKAGRAIDDVAETINDGVEYVSGKRIPKPTLTKDIAEETMKEQTLYGRLLGKELNVGGVIGITGLSMATSTANAVSQNGGEKFAKLGYVTAGENLERLISYDGSGFMNRINEVSNGDYEVMSDIVQNTFTEPSQFGANGSIVFALHNMREG